MARLALTFVTLLAFLIQSHVTQTHIHLLAPAGDAVAGFGVSPASTSAKAQQNQNRHELPSKDDPANCPLCQQIAVAGAFVTPVTALLLPPVRIGTHSPPTITGFFLAQLTSHIWQGRAPPIL